MDWRPQASKMVVLIADAPPHGIGEYGDGIVFSCPIPAYFSLMTLGLSIGFDSGSPDGNDPLQIARAMASRGITLVSRCLSILLSQPLLTRSSLQFFVACEPALSGYSVRTSFPPAFISSFVSKDSNIHS